VTSPARRAVSGLRTRLRSGESLTAAFLDLGSAVSAEITARSGFDLLVIDLEHGAGDAATARTQIVAAEPHAAAVVRLPGIDADPSPMLDFGAAGILFPRAESAQEVTAAAASTRYGGRRGVSPLARSAAWGATADGWKQAADEGVACIIQIERRAALESVEEIAALDDVDALLVGPADLSNDLGCALDLDGGPLAEAAERVARAALTNGKGAGIHLPDAGLAGDWAGRGFNLLSASFESQLLGAGSRDVAALLRRGLVS
jgi:2-keto-3-deoxy-L-rhamnonate aldolase RhmA